MLDDILSIELKASGEHTIQVLGILISGGISTTAILQIEFGFIGRTPTLYEGYLCLGLIFLLFVMSAIFRRSFRTDETGETAS